MKISIDFKLARSAFGLQMWLPLAFENFLMDLLLGNWCMSVYFASFLVGKQDPYEYRCEHYERVAIKQQHDTCVAYLHIHIAGSVFLFFIC